MSEDDTTTSTRDVADGENVVISDGETIHHPKDADVAGHTDDERLPARADDFDDVPPALRLAAAADGMSEFNRILKEIAKSVWYTTAILLGFFAVFVAYLVAKWGLTLV